PGGGCAVGPNFPRPPAPAERGYTPEAAASTAVADGKSQRFVEGQTIEGDWWRILQSPALDAIVSRVLANNPGLDAARATLRESQDNPRAGCGGEFPPGGAR